MVLRHLVLPLVPTGPLLRECCGSGASSLGRAGRASLSRMAGLGLAGLALVWLWFGWLFLGFGLISVGFGLISGGLRLISAWILHFRLLF